MCELGSFCICNLIRCPGASNLILPRVDLPLSLSFRITKNIGFHYVSPVAYPLPLDRRGHESKALLAHHGYPSRLHPNRRCAAAETIATDRNASLWVGIDQ